MWRRLVVFVNIDQTTEDMSRLGCVVGSESVLRRAQSVCKTRRETEAKERCVNFVGAPCNIKQQTLSTTLFLV